MTTTRVKFDTEHFSFHVVSVDNDYRRTDRKTRVSAPTPDMSDTPTPPYGRRGENAEDDKAWRAYNRLELQRMSTALAEAHAELVDPAYEDVAIEGVGVDGDTLTSVIRALEGKLTFSRKAGCSCGCSPSFIADGRYRMTATYEYSGATQTYPRAIDTIFVSRREAPKTERTYTMADFALVGD